MGYSIAFYVVGLGLAVSAGMVALGWAIGRLVGFLADEAPSQPRESATNQSLSGRAHS